MAAGPKPYALYMRVGEALSLFVQMGCELDPPPGRRAHDGRRFLWHETNRRLVAAPHQDEAFIPLDVVLFWERHLGVVIPLSEVRR